MRKKFLSTILILSVILTMLPISVLAAEKIPETEEVPEINVSDISRTLTTGLDSPFSGTCGENVTWSLDVVGALTIKGTGEMADFSQNFTNIERNSVRSVIIQEGVTGISDNAFSGCYQLVKVTLPNSLKNIGDGAFWDCANLTDMVIPDSVTGIGANAFNGCKNLTGKITLKNTTDIGTNAFKSCSGITALDIHGNIGLGAFSYCTSLKYVNITGASQMNAYAFLECTNLTKINIPDGVTRIEYGTFKGCSNLKSMIIPDSVTGTIGAWSFENCSKLESVILSKNAQLFRDQGWTFNGCSNLKYIFIPRGVRYLSGVQFQKCDNLTDIYFEGNENDWKAVDVSMPLENITIHYSSKPGDVPMPPEDDTDEKKYVTFYPSGAPSKTLGVDWSWDLFDGESSYYNNSLSAVALALSAAVENSQTAAETELRNLGFTTVESKNFTSNFAFQPGVTFGHKITMINEEPRHIFAIVGRGTSNGWDFYTDIESLADAFNTSATVMKAQFNYFVQNTCHLSANSIKNNSKFFITGHSLGGAVANLIAKDFNGIYKEKNIFAYTFASPKTASFFGGTFGNSNIINILNVDDVVTRIPPTQLGIIPLIRYGQNWKISRNDFSNPSFYDIYKDLTSKTFSSVDSGGILGTGIAGKEHAVQTYMSFVLGGANGQSVSIPHSGDFMTVCYAACPVDVEVYTSDGQLVSKTANGIAENHVPDQVFIDVADDVKNIYLLDHGDYSLNFLGTDTGTMEYAVQGFDLGNSVATDKKVFAQVALTKGKKMSSKVSVWDKNDNTIDSDGKVDVPNVQLFVTDENGNVVKEVLPDENSTEIYIPRTITFDANGGVVEPSAIVTETSGKLSALPTPVRDGYTFSGWFTNATEGTQITADMVFTSETTVYAHWADNGSTPDNDNKPGDDKNLPFVDVNPADWYYEPAKFVFSRNIMTGMDGTHFGPDKRLSRAQFATILYRMEKSPETTYDAGAFPDVGDGLFYTRPAMWAKSTGIITGYADGSFGPADDITREQMAVMMYRYAAMLKLDTSVRKDLGSFPDGSSVSGFAQEAVRWAVGEELIRGDNGKINPQGKAERGQCATIIMRYMQKYGF